jgi:CBS domain-containing protein
MASTVREIMNRELFSVRPSDSVADAVSGILGLGVTTAPVLDAGGCPLGVVSLRDLVGPKTGLTATDRMSVPAVVVRESSSIDDAAKLVGEAGYRHLVVVDDRGRAVGMLSSVDVVRGLVGLPAHHPDSFPRLDAKTGLAWTEDLPLTNEDIDAAPDGPGILVLVHGGASVPERVVWVGSSHNVRTRLIDLLSLPQDDAELRHWLERREHLRFRAAAVTDARAREKITKALQTPERAFLGEPARAKR